MSNTLAVKNHPGIYTYPTKGGKRYAAVATVKGEQRWSRGHRTIAEAEDAKSALKHALKTGTVAKTTGPLTLDDYLNNQWMPSLDVQAGTMRAYRIDVDRIIDTIGKYRLGQLAPHHIETLKKALKEKNLAPTTQANTYWRLSQALQRAVRWRLISRNPCDDVDAPKKGHYQSPQVETEDVQRILEAADASGWGMVVYLAVATGMRSGELFALRWQDVDVPGALLRIPRSKTDAGVRAVAVGPDTLERLRVHRMEQMRRFQRAANQTPATVFTTLDGLPLRQVSFWPHWDKIRAGAGIPELHFHDLRHIHATLLARAGIHPSIAQRRLGHADAKLTMDVYTHATASDQIPAAVAIEGALSKRLAQPE